MQFDISMGNGWHLRCTDVTGSVTNETGGCSLYTDTWYECNDLEWCEELISPNDKVYNGDNIEDLCEFLELDYCAALEDLVQEYINALIN